MFMSCLPDGPDAQRAEGLAVGLKEAAEHFVKLQTEHLNGDEQALETHDRRVADDDDQRIEEHVRRHLRQREHHRHHARVRQREAAHAQEAHRVRRERQQRVKHLEESVHQHLAHES